MKEKQTILKLRKDRNPLNLFVNIGYDQLNNVECPEESKNAVSHQTGQVRKITGGDNRITVRAEKNTPPPPPPPK